MTWPAVPARPPGAPDLMTFGEVMVLLRAETGVPLRMASRFHRDIAGAESNVAVGLARLGHRVTLAVRVGDDPFGEAIVAICRAEGIDIVATVDAMRPTGLLIRDVFDERPIEVMYHRAGSAASALTVGDLPLDAIAASRVLHVTGITPVLSDGAADATYRAVAEARANGTVVSFDPNLRRRLADPATAVARWMPIIERSDIVLAGADEAAVIVGTMTSGPSAASGPSGISDTSGDREQTAAWFHDLGVEVIVVKDGIAGSWASDGERLMHQPAVPVRTVDPVGAGDAFAAGFLSELLDGGGLDQALRSGAAVAACAVQVAGDIGGLPTRSERERLLATDRRHNTDVLR